MQGGHSTPNAVKDVETVDFERKAAKLNIWVKVFKNGPSKIFKGCLARMLLGPFLNTLSHIFNHLAAKAALDPLYFIELYIWANILKLFYFCFIY